MNTVLAFSAFCGFSFAEDNQYILDPDKTKYVSRIKQVFHDLWIASSEEWHFKVESEVVYLNVCKFLQTLAADSLTGTIFPN